MDGLETNDPLTNLNSGLATNLVLGLNSIEEVTVNTTSYAVDQGRYGASQVNYVTKSGTNNFHGNLYELWNGSKLNAANFFTNATGGHKPRSNVNHFGGSLGGPVVHDKLFFFGDFEQMRIALPIVSNVTVPIARVPELRACAASARRRGFRLRRQLPRGARSGSVLSQDVLALPGTPAARRCRFWAARSTATAARLAAPSQRQWMRQPPHHLAIQRGPRAGDHRAHRSQHRRRQHGLVPLPVRYRPTGGLHRSDQSDFSTPSRRSRCTRSRPDTRTSSVRTW